MTIVIDSSAIVALALTDEDAAYAESVLDSLAVESAAVPMLFWYDTKCDAPGGTKKQNQPSGRERFSKRVEPTRNQNRHDAK